MKILGRLFAAGVVIFVLLQIMRPSIPEKPATADLQAPPQVKQVLDKSCYSCHSDERRLAWFDEIVPAYWLVRHDVLTAREHLNFSTLGARPAATQKATLYEAVNMIQLGAMPLPRFLALHPEAKVTPDDLAVLKAYLCPWTQPERRVLAAPADMTSDTAPVSLAAVRPEWNGLAFDPAFEKWKPLSTTDRGDNNTFRFILGNDIAIKATQSGAISPWPDGSRFAKIAWQQQLGTDGLMHPGKFVQVELMVKDASRYKETEGWGWGRWRGLDLKPYGNDAHFTSECTGCHQPLSGNDYVYTIPISSAHVAREVLVNNRAAALPASLPYQPLGWNAITMYANPDSLTMATLYGNDAAIRSAHPRTSGTVTYAPGTVLALVTWAQREDPHWFGARIPDLPQSVEFVSVGVGGQNSYRRFAGSELTEEPLPSDKAAQRANFMLSLAPARLP